MPRAKKHPAEPGASPATLNGSSSNVLTLAETAAYLRVPEAEVVALVRTQGLPGRCIAGQWRFLKAAIQYWLGAASTTWDARKAAILELAGKYEDDPDLEQIVEDAFRRRGRKFAGARPSKGLSG